MLSRVIPASGPVMSRSSPMILLMSVDLPAFGRPMTAICRGFVAVGRTSPDYDRVAPVLLRSTNGVDWIELDPPAPGG